MSEPELPEGIDRKLSFRSTEREGVHYLLGNGHTFRGRMAAIHEDGFGVNVSLSEIVDPSDFVRAWVDGFLAGSEPDPPDDESPESLSRWRVEVQRYRRTGEVRNYECPVCGYPDLTEPPFVGGEASFEICPCCGVEFGYQDTGRTHAQLRKQWIDSGMPWHSRAQGPSTSWDPKEQLRLAELD